MAKKMFFTFNEKTLQKLEKEIGEKARAMANDPAMLIEIGNIVIDDIKYQTRLGRSPITGQKFEPLSLKWKKERGEIAKATKTHEAYSQNRSNLTLTGQLLDSMQKKLLKEGIQISFEGNHKPYRKKYSDRSKKSGGTYPVGKTIKNEDLATYVAERGRAFFGVREKILEQLKKVVIKHIRRKL
jgi:hypothetical protein